MNKVGVCGKAFAGIDMKGEFINKLKAGGRFLYECFDKAGNLKWKDESHNVVTDEGIDYLLDMVFGSTSKEAAWYIGLYTATAGALGDLTGADIGGANLTEFITYSGNRKLFSGVRSGQTWTNVSSPGEFAINANATIKGAFLANDNVGTATYLLSIDAFTAGDRAVAPGDTLKVTYVFDFSTA